MKKELFCYKEYGYIEINIRKIMDEKRITRNALARSIGARFEVVNKWYHGKVEKIDADVLARICYVLECDPGDIIQYHEEINKQ